MRHAACHGMPNPWNPPEESPRGAHFHIWPCGPRGGYMSPPSRDNPPGPPNPQLENQHLGVPGATFNFATQFKIVQIMPGSLLCELWPSECYVFRSPKCSDANHVLRCPYRTMRLHALLGGTWWNMVEPRISAVFLRHRIKTIKRLGMARPLDSLDCNGASLICPYLSC